MLKQRKFIIAGIIVLVAIAFLGYRGFAESAVYDYKVGEFLTQQRDFNGKNVRVTGTVADGSVVRDGPLLKFSMSDGEQTLPVVYTGTVPDSFKAGADAVVEGQLDSQGNFEATVLLAKCPSKYEPEVPPA